jgi:transcriptional regulator with XRE-family HTH domain
MQLVAYLKEHHLNYAEFGRVIGCTREAVRKYASGECSPSAKRMVKIALATGGKVTANDFLGIGTAESGK